MDALSASSDIVYQPHVKGDRTNFTSCAAYYSQNYSANPTYAWAGSVTGFEKTSISQITTRGCNDLCGIGNDWYPWSQQAGTITTWVLPIVGIILQAPFVSNAFWETVFSLSRWIGSPICSLTYVLWNVKVTGRCALLLDMAGPYTLKRSSVVWDSEFAEMRDSFYLLTVMNQFTMRASVRRKKEAETLLRIVLFSKDLRLLKPTKQPHGHYVGVPPEWQVNSVNVSRSTREDDLEPQGYLNRRRRDLASGLRAGRKRGVVPVYISTMWFLFSLTLSIQAAFGELGENAQAHDLALGLLLAWLPVLILSSIVDRNLIAVDEIKETLNTLVDRVRLSLTDDLVCRKFLDTIGHDHSQDHDKWLNDISRECPSLHDFFVHFAGQGRKRYHYGAAHPILTDIESAYVAAQGRGWLRNEEEARSKLVLGDSSGGLDWLDPRELWQVLSALLIVVGAILGAFIISYFTPTVGLGCRSGGYMIFGTMAFGLLLVEMVSWWVFDASKAPLENLRRVTLDFVDSHWEGRSKRHRVQQAAREKLDVSLRAFSGALNVLKPWCPEPVRRWGASRYRLWQSMPGSKRLDYWLFKPAECGNAVWLIYIVLAQTTGSYNNCDCKSSNWAGGGGYVTWNTDPTGSYSERYWVAGIVLSSTTMVVAMAYIVIEWCLQSHLSTGNAESAARGLQRTRHFRWLTSPYRWLFELLIDAGYKCRLLLFRVCFGVRKDDPEEPRASRKSLRWTKEITRKTSHPKDPSTTSPRLNVPKTRSRGDSGSSIPLMLPVIICSDSRGRQVAADIGAQEVCRYADTPSPRSSGERAASPFSGPV